MSIWNLPELREDGNFPPAKDRSGEWLTTEANLQTLGDALQVPARKGGDHHQLVRAIPDPWAQARTFAEALIAGQDNHSLYNIALPQWRGLLALFALQGFHSKVYTLTPRQFTLGEGKTAKMFDRVLTHLHPQFAIGGDASLWTSPVLFMISGPKLKERPIAMGNPGCFVSPGRLTHKETIPNVAWYNEHGLRDPLACELPVTQLFVLKEWLEHLRASIDGQPGEVTPAIIARLNAYIADCEAETAELNLRANIGASLYDNLSPLYAPLFATAALLEPGDGAATSQTRLQLDPGCQLGALKGFILVDEALTRDPQFDRRKTMVWGNSTLGDLLVSEETRKNVADKAAEKGWAIITSDDLYTPRVVRFVADETKTSDSIDEKEALIAGNPSELESTLVPLRPLSLLLSGTLAERLSSRVGGERAIFTLSLVLEDASGTARTVNLQRHFTRNPQAGEGLYVKDEGWNFFHASIWPDFRAKNWDSYFARFSYARAKQKVMVRPLVALSRQIIINEIAGPPLAAPELGGGADEEAAQQAPTETPDARKTAVAKFTAINNGRSPTLSGGNWINAIGTDESSFEEIQVSRLPFEAIVYADQFKDRGEALAGMALLAVTPIQEPTGEPTIAIDFGTTNTVACFADKRPVQFMRRLVHPVTHRASEDLAFELGEARWFMMKFFPPEARMTPTPTVALQRTEYTATIAHHIFANVIYFHSQQSHVVNRPQEELKAFRRLKDVAKFDLKWSTEATHLAASRGFLHQFALMAAAEAAADRRDHRKMEWRFSVPDSLDPYTRSEFEQGLKKITAQISGKEAGGNLSPLYSEGLAAAHYILKASDFKEGDVNIVLDIGGGTTDVTVWDREEVKWKGSFRLAGKAFFTRYIIQNPQILGKIGLPLWQSLFETGGSGEHVVDDRDLADLAEMLFSGPLLQRAIDANWDDMLSADVGDDLRMVATTFLAGIAWYMGRIVRELVTAGKLREDQLDIPAFALCGRGAGIFKMMHGKRSAEDESEVTRALLLFSKAAGLEKLPRPQLFTTQPQDAKLEVVRGMISDDGLVDSSAASGKADAEEFVLSGLGLTLKGGGEIGAKAKIAKDGGIVGPITQIDFAEIKAMVAELDALVKIKLDLNDASNQGALRALDLEVSKLGKSKRDGGDAKANLQPPFIVALGELVAMMAKPSAQRHGRLKMSYRR